MSLPIPPLGPNPNTLSGSSFHGDLQRLEEGNYVGISVDDVTGSEPKPSFLAACWQKLLHSVYTFFSYVSYFLTCCFRSGSFRDVTAGVSSPTEDQVLAASLLEDFGNKWRLLREYQAFSLGRRRFYEHQQEFLLSYLGALVEGIDDLIINLGQAPLSGHSLEESKSIVQGEGEEEHAQASRLLENILEQVERLKKNADYREFAVSLEDQVENSKNLPSGAVELSVQMIVLTIREQWRHFNLELEKMDRLTSKLQQLFFQNSNSSLAQTATVVEPAGAIANIPPANIQTSGIQREELQELFGLHDGSLAQLREESQRSQRGFENNMLLLQEKVQGHLRFIRSEVHKIKMKKLQEENQRANQARRESLARGAGRF